VGLAAFARVEKLVSLDGLDGALDLWACMWRPEEKESFETAVVRTLIDPHPARTRLLALGLCHVIATPRLLAAAARIAERGGFAPEAVRFVEKAAQPRALMRKAASQLRGNVFAVEHLLERVIVGEAGAWERAVLDWIDVRDLVAVARTTLDARLFAEVERRLARRGPYQRGRAAHVLGFKVRDAADRPAGYGADGAM
jgi:hypothetical protein